MSEKNINQSVNEEVETGVMVRSNEETTDLATPQIFGGGNAALQFWTSIPDDGDARKRAANVSRLMGPADHPLSSFKEKVISVTNVLAHNVTILTDEATGEMAEATRVVFLLEDGSTVDTVSSGVVSSLKNVFALAGMPPWNNPLKLSLKESNTRRGRRVYSLMICE